MERPGIKFDGGKAKMATALASQRWQARWQGTAVWRTQKAPAGAALEVAEVCARRVEVGW